MTAGQGNTVIEILTLICKSLDRIAASLESLQIFQENRPTESDITTTAGTREL